MEGAEYRELTIHIY
jgi:CTD small phosphatase-like protein 2